jgi:hypothetical protein
VNHDSQGTWRDGSQGYPSFFVSIGNVALGQGVWIVKH